MVSSNWLHFCRVFISFNNQENAQKMISGEDYLPTAVYRWALQDYAAAKQWIDAQADSPAKAAALKKLEPRK